jgi:hypothetical protein
MRMVAWHRRLMSWHLERAFAGGSLLCLTVGLMLSLGYAPKAGERPLMALLPAASGEPAVTGSVQPRAAAPSSQQQPFQAGAKRAGDRHGATGGFLDQDMHKAPLRGSF